MEALVACRIVHSEACKFCLYRKCLRYNGGLDDACSWADIVCIKCHATYEIKSKKDPDTVQKGFENGFRGRSFRTFAGLEELGQRYLLVVSRTPVSVKGELCHPITVATIDHVIPQLSSESFDLSRESIRLRTIIKATNRKV